MATVIVGVILLAIVGAIVYGMVKDKKNGKSTCGGDCGHCKGGGGARKAFSTANASVCSFENAIFAAHVAEND